MAKHEKVWRKHVHMDSYRRLEVQSEVPLSQSEEPRSDDHRRTRIYNRRRCNNNHRVYDVYSHPAAIT